MRTKFILLLFILFAIKILPQFSPYSYKMGNEKKVINKISSSNPLSNSITDIITVGDTIWLGTSRGVSLSTDGGENWDNFYGKSDFGTDNISAIGYYNGLFWCATARSTEVTGGDVLPEGTGLKYTSDLGKTWHTISQPLDAETDTVEQYGANQIRTLPVTVTIQNITYDIAFTSNTIWIASFAGELRKANIDSLLSNNNYKWKRVILPPDYLDSISPSDTLSFCLSPADGNFCGTGNLNHRVFAVLAVDDYTIFAGTAGGVNKSTDGGISWKKFNAQNQSKPISGNFITALGYNITDNTIWASTWKAEDQSEFYGVSSSGDGGETWNTFLNDERPHNFGFKDGDVLVPTDNGVFRTSDKGATWILPNTIIDSDSKFELKTNMFYCASSGNNNVWLGSDDGLVKLNELPDKMWQGEWKIFIASQSVGSENDTYCYPNPFSPRLETLKIKYSTNGADANVTIRIFDFGFNYVRTVIQNTLRNRDLDSTPDFWDGKDDNGSYVPNGVYFYRIDIGDKDPIYGKILVLQ